MILSALQPSDPPADVCIIGAGPVGLALALTLEEQGKSVLLIDAGPVGGGGRSSFPTTPLNRHHAPLEHATATGLGGTTALWGGRCVTFDDIDFATRNHVPHSGWPISHHAITPYYARALRFLNCMPDGEHANQDDDPEQPVHFQATEWWSTEPNLAKRYYDRISSSSLIRFLPCATVTAINAKAGMAMHLCLIHAGRQHVQPLKKLVLCCGGIGNTRLLKTLYAQNDQTPPALGRFYQGHLTGYLAVAELKQEAVARLSFRENRFGTIFRRRMQVAPQTQQRLKLLNTVFWLDPISIADPIHGSATLSTLYLALRLTGLYDRLGKRNAASSKPRARIPLRSHFANLIPSVKVGRDYLTALKSIFTSANKRHALLTNNNGRYLLRYHAEQVPNFESRIYSSPAHDVGSPPDLVIDYQLCQLDIDSVLHSHEILDQWLRTNGHGELDYLHAPADRQQAVVDQAFDGFHQIGLTKMSRHPGDGVVDADCRMHDIGNLYVAGSCVFPTGGHANPTLPAVALAIRLGEHLSALPCEPFRTGQPEPENTQAT